MQKRLQYILECSKIGKITKQMNLEEIIYHKKNNLSKSIRLLLK